MTLLALAGIAGSGGGPGAQPVLGTEPGVEVTADGLYPVHPSIMLAAWVKPDTDLSRYTRIFFLPTIVQYREATDRRYEQRKLENRIEFPVSDSLRLRLTEQFGESFYEAVSRVRSYELSSKPGRDVLMVQGFLTDVTSAVPPEVAGSNVSSVKWAFDANIIIELRDSMSDEILARTVDHQRVEGPFAEVEIWSLTPNIARGWSRLLVTRLRELSALYPSRLRRLQELSGE
jgi:hypothetical protein